MSCDGVGFLIEHYAGNFPLWLAPDQVRVITIGDDEKLAGHAKMLRGASKGSVAQTAVTSTDRETSRLAARGHCEYSQDLPHLSPPRPAATGDRSRPGRLSNAPSSCILFAAPVN